MYEVSSITFDQKALQILNYSDKCAKCISGVPRVVEGIFGPDGAMAGDRAYVSFSCKNFHNMHNSSLFYADGGKSYQDIEFIDFLFPGEIHIERFQLYGRENEKVVKRVIGCAMVEKNLPLLCPWNVLWESTDPKIEVQDEDDTFEGTWSESTFISRWKLDLKMTRTFPCNVIRIEVDKKMSEIHEIWSAVVCGIARTIYSPPMFPSGFLSPTLCHTFESYHVTHFIQMTPGWIRITKPPETDHEEKYGADESQKEDLVVKENENQACPESECGQPSLLERLPTEVLLKIFRCLDILDLCRLARCSRLLNTVAWSALTRPRSRQLLLRPYWHRLNDAFLSTISKGGDLRLHHVDLSWCGSYKLISFEGGMQPLLNACGVHLLSLSLAFCDAVDEQVLSLIAAVCPNLIELDLSGCKCLNDSEVLLKLLPLAPQLRRLDLVRCRVMNNAALDFFSQTEALRSVDLSGCDTIVPSPVIQTIASSARSLEAIQLRFLQYVTPESLQVLASHCPGLTTLDLTKSYRAESGGSLHSLLCHWPQMKRLYLGGSRSLTARDVASMWEFCPLLEQVDISGAHMNTWSPTIEQLLLHCPHLVYLDVSFIGLKLVDVDRLRQNFPKVTIKQDRHVPF